MKRFHFLLLCIPFLFTACTKYKEEIPQTPLPVSTMLKTGDWMVNTYVENGINISTDIGITYIKFNQSGSLVATKEGNDYNGNWSETKSETSHTFKISITTPDVKMQKFNGTWKVTGVSEYFIDLKDGNSTGNAAMNLMKH